ncbi:unnamed protein product [Prunus armeniaca]
MGDSYPIALSSLVWLCGRAKENARKIVGEKFWVWSEKRKGKGRSLCPVREKRNKGGKNNNKKKRKAVGVGKLQVTTGTNHGTPSF